MLDGYVICYNASENNTRSVSLSPRASVSSAHRRRSLRSVCRGLVTCLSHIIARINLAENPSKTDLGRIKRDVSVKIDHF